MQYKAETDLKSVRKNLLSLSLPMALTQLVTVGSTFIAMAMVAQLGHDVLAASALIFSARISIILICGSLLFSLSILIGHAFGQNKYALIGTYIQQGWLLALLLCIPVMLLFWFMAPILKWFGQSPDLLPYIQTFFHANIWNIFPFLIAICNQQLCYGTRKQMVDLVANMLGVVALLVGSYAFIFGHFGCRAMGIAGLAYAMNLQGWVYLAYTMIIIFTNSYFTRFNLLELQLRQTWSCFKEMCRVGWPICVQIGCELLSFIVSTAIIGWLGEASLAACQVVNQYIFLVVVPMFSLAQANGILIGQALGAKKNHEVRLYVQTGMLYSLVFTSIVAVIFFTMPTTLASVYLDVSNVTNAATLKWVIILFMITGVTQIFDGVRNILVGSLRGLLDTRFPMYVSLVGIWLIGIPLGYLLAFTFQYGLGGMAVGGSIGMLFSTVLLLGRWRQQSRLHSF